MLEMFGLENIVDLQVCHWKMIACNASNFGRFGDQREPAAVAAPRRRRGSLVSSAREEDPRIMRRLK